MFILLYIVTKEGKERENDVIDFRFLLKKETLTRIVILYCKLDNIETAI